MLEVIEEGTVASVIAAATTNTVSRKPSEKERKYERLNRQWTSFRLKSSSSELNSTLFRDYFATLVEQGYNKYLWQYHSALNDWLLHNLCCELKDYDGYRLVTTFIKENIDDKNIKQAKVLCDNAVAIILQNLPETGQELMLKAFFVCGIFGLHRVDDSYRMKRGNTTVDRKNKRFIIHLDDSKTGPTNTVIEGQKNSKYDSICPFRILVKYYDESETTDVNAPFWRRYQVTKTGGYFGKSTVGINTMRKWIQKILNHSTVHPYLPTDVRASVDSYTGHSLRRTAATLYAGLDDIRFDEIQRLGRWSSASTAQRYIESSPATKGKTVNRLNKHLAQKTDNNQNCEEDSDVANDGLERFDEKKFVFNNCTVNLHFH